MEIGYGWCYTCDPETCATTLGPCRLSLKESTSDNQTLRREKKDTRTYQLTATSCQGFNDLVCGPFNREGLLCSKCKPGYGPAPYANSLKCEKCHDKYTGWLWLLYLLLELIPLTIFSSSYLIFVLHCHHSPPLSFSVSSSQNSSKGVCIFK